MTDQHDLLQDHDDAATRRHELVRDLGLRGGFQDRRLRELVFDRLGAAALSDEGLLLLDRLVSVLAKGKGSEA